MIVIDYRDKRPIYEQIVERFQTLIVSGGMEADEKLPSVRALAVELSINPNTIQRAYAELEREGFIYAVKGRGNFVSGDAGIKKKQQDKMLSELGDCVKYCLRQGISETEIRERVDNIIREERL